MKKRIASWVVLALLATVSASAQISNRIEVTVPFSFVVAGTSWAAGTYKLDIQPNTGFAMLHSTESVSRIFLTQVSQPTDSLGTQVRFQRYGNQWVLREILVDGLQAHVLPGKFEREIMSRKPSEARPLVAHLQR
jgi:hypothetical protein